MSALGPFSEVDARIGEVCFAPINGLRQSGLLGPKSAMSGSSPTPNGDKARSFNATAVSFKNSAVSDANRVATPCVQFIAARETTRMKAITGHGAFI